MSKLKRLYREEWIRFKTGYAKIFLMAALAFLLAAILSHGYFVRHPEMAQEKLMDLAQRLLEKIPMDRGALILYIAIAANNIIASTLALGAGLIPFLFLPVLAVFINGGAMGILSAMLTLKGADLASVLLFGLAPHGVFEIPAFLYACSLGIGINLWLVRLVFRELFTPPEAGAVPEAGRGGQEESFPALIARTFRTWLLVIIPLLLLAAFMEAFITPVLIKSFIGDIGMVGP
jgi:stage II sporulation protein M